ncbi:MAG: thiamine-phosphate kinase [Candidatus Margulisbacteria bacterium]|nr:thiamine-phosphate kinase [Candidatus Margulisiibacteriota bacterium]
MKLSNIGEFGLIDRIAKREPRLPSTIIGIGDDAAVLQMTNEGKYLLITTDTLIENVHFKRKGASFFRLGQKALAANISDIAAMGGWPAHALVTVGVPKTMSVKAIDELYRGINALARKQKIDIIGGDTVASPKEIVISITLLGEVEKANLLLRSTARVGDLICVTGKFGGPAAKGYPSHYALRVTLFQEARALAKSGLATAMIDSSDGLVRSILEICKASRVGAVVYESEVPVARGASLAQALHGGEEYELVFTIPAKNIRKLKKVLGRTKVSIVGDICPRKSGVNLLDKHGRIKEIKSGGYEHFK